MVGLGLLAISMPENQDCKTATQSRCRRALATLQRATLCTSLTERALCLLRW